MADGLIKRGKYWHMDFIFEGRRVQGSTKHTNINRARIFVAKYKANLADERIGLAPAKVSPLFRDFMRVAEKDDDSHGPFLDYVERHAKAKNTLDFYKKRTAQLLKFPGFRDKRLSEIDGELVERYCAFRRSNTQAVTPITLLASDTSPLAVESPRVPAISTNTLNGELKTLRKALKLAEEWGLLKKVPKVRQLPGAKGRDFVVSPALEKLYLEKATYPLKQIATLIVDLGLRPEESVSLRKEHIADGTVRIPSGKTSNAARTLPLTARAKETIRLCSALFPDSEWLFPGRKGHYERGSADDRHAALRQELAAIANGAGTDREAIAVVESAMPADAKDFVLHGFRHTYGTRLAESGASVFEIKYLMGHSSIKMSEKYIHFRESSVTLAAKRKEIWDMLNRGEVPHDLTPETVRK